METTTPLDAPVPLAADTGSPAPTPAPQLGSVYAITYGCQMNVLDTELALSALARGGSRRVEHARDADVVVVNTCSIRDLAEEKAYSFLGTLKKRKRENPSLVVAVIGCMAQKEGDVIFRRAPYVDIVAGTRHFTRVAEYVESVKRDGKRILALGRNEDVRTEIRSPRVRDDRASAFVAVMRGCDHHCTYCVVPNTRGIETSRPLDEIVREVEVLVGDGVIEVTLLGQNIDSYGKRLQPRLSLADLIHRVAEVRGLERLRFITSHPSDIKPELIACFRPGAIPKLMPYFHFPAQSGSDEVLRRMRRGYTHQRYLDIVREVRAVRPDIGIAGDTIVGFCGETEEDFARTMELHRAVRYQQAYMFTYSERAHTPAVTMGLVDDVAPAVKSERLARLMALQREIQEEDNRRMVGKTFEVLVTGASKSDPQTWTGRSPQHQIVHFRSGRPDLTGNLIHVVITHTTDLALYGDPVAASGA